MVDRLFTGNSFKTDVWISEAAKRELAEFVGNPDGKRFIKKLEYYAKSGFDAFRTSDGPIRHEGDGVWRIGNSATRIRLIGFYDAQDGKATFIVIDAFTKSGQALSAAQRQRIKTVAEIRNSRNWRKGQTQ